MGISIIKNQTVPFLEKHFGAELIANGSFSVGTGWTFENATWSISTVNGVMRHTNAGAGYTRATVAINGNTTYRVQFDIRRINNPVGEDITVTLGGRLIGTIASEGFYELWCDLGTATDSFLEFTAGAQFECRIGAVSVKQYLGSDTEFNSLSENCNCI